MGILWDNTTEACRDFTLGCKVTWARFKFNLRVSRHQIVMWYERKRWPIILTDTTPRPAYNAAGEVVLWLADDEPFPEPWIEEKA